MGFGSQGTTKLEYARKVAGTLGYLASQQGDAVGVTCVANGIVKHLPPKQNPAHLRLMFDVLEETAPAGKIKLVPVLHELAETVRQRALIVVISDFFVPPSALAGCFQHLRFRHHDVALFICLTHSKSLFVSSADAIFLIWREGRRSLSAKRHCGSLRQSVATISWRNETSRVGISRRLPRVLIDEDFEQVLLRFLIQRAESKERR